jgi:hypothetical protein
MDVIEASEKVLPKGRKIMWKKKLHVIFQGDFQGDSNCGVEKLFQWGKFFPCDKIKSNLRLLKMKNCDSLGIYWNEKLLAENCAICNERLNLRVKITKD